MLLFFLVGISTFSINDSPREVARSMKYEVCYIGFFVKCLTREVVRSMKYEVCYSGFFVKCLTESCGLTKRDSRLNDLWIE